MTEPPSEANERFKDKSSKSPLPYGQFWVLHLHKINLLPNGQRIDHEQREAVTHSVNCSLARSLVLSLSRSIAWSVKVGACAGRSAIFFGPHLCVGIDGVSGRSPVELSRRHAAVDPSSRRADSDTVGRRHTPAARAKAVAERPRLKTGTSELTVLSGG